MDADFGVLNGKFDSSLIERRAYSGHPGDSRYRAVDRQTRGQGNQHLEPKCHRRRRQHGGGLGRANLHAGPFGLPRFRAEGDVAADANELVIKGHRRSWNSPTPPTTATPWQGALGSGDAKLTLDWADNFYSLHVAVNGLLGIFDVEGDLVFSSGNEIALLATATVVIPQRSPSSAGTRSAASASSSSTSSPTTTCPRPRRSPPGSSIDIFTTFQVGFELVIDGNGHLSDAQFIGGSQVSQFEADVQPPVNQTYTYIYQPTFGAAPGQVPAAASSLILSADWSQSAAGVAFSGRAARSSSRRSCPASSRRLSRRKTSPPTASRSSATPSSTDRARAVQIVGSPTDPFAPLTAQEVRTSGGHYDGWRQPLPGLPEQVAHRLPEYPGYLYPVPSPTFGPVSSANGGEPPQLPSTTSPTGALPRSPCRGNVDERAPQPDERNASIASTLPTSSSAASWSAAARARRRPTSCRILQVRGARSSLHRAARSRSRCTGTTRPGRRGRSRAPRE